MIEKTIKFSLMPQQIPPIKDNKHKFILLSGGVRAGKSSVLIGKLLTQALIPGANTFLIRKTQNTIRKSTLVTLKEILPPGSYKYNTMSQTITLNGGGTIWLLGLDKETKLRSMEADFIAIDEAIELTRSDYDMLKGRLSGKKGSRQIMLSTNPGTPSHWLYQEFYLKNNPLNKVYELNTRDNKHLPDDFILALNDYDNQTKKRMMDGIWCNLEGAVFHNFNRDIHVKHLSRSIYDSCKEFYIGIDFGFKDPNAIILVGRAGERNYVLDEFYENKCSIDQIETAVSKIIDKCHSTPYIVADPSAAQWRHELLSKGIKTLKANNSQQLGLGRIISNLNMRNDSPDLIISDNCTNLLREMENYQYKEGTDIPIDKDNHAIDALKYIFNAIYESDSSQFNPVCYYGDDTNSDEDDLFDQ